MTASNRRFPSPWSIEELDAAAAINSEQMMGMLTVSRLLRHVEYLRLVELSKSQANVRDSH
jgi:hypothetical protein